MTEREIGEALAAAIRGDRDAFAHLVREHQAMVFSVAYHFLHDASKAEDLAQETFLHLFRNLASIESPAHLVYWLRRVATHRSIDESRRRLRRAGNVSLDAVAEPASHDHPRDPFLSEALEKLVATLPEPQRAVVVLRYQEDMEPTEIAEVLGVPVNTVKSRLHRGLEFLRKKMPGPARGVDV
jgi:RNA polymerase sigma-70 factor (ECF subfamily)